MKPIKRSYNVDELSKLAALKYLQAAMAPPGSERNELIKLADGYRARVSARRWVEDQIELAPVPQRSYQ